MSETTNVSVTLGYTLNLGNFQSLRIDLGITDFVRSGENTDQALDRVYQVASQLNGIGKEAVDELTKN